MQLHCHKHNTWLIVAAAVADLIADVVYVVELQQLQVHDHNKYLFNHLVNWSMMHLPKDNTKPKETIVGGVPHDPGLVMKNLKGHADIKAWLSSEEALHPKWQGETFLEAAHNDAPLQTCITTCCQPLQHKTPLLTHLHTHQGNISNLAGVLCHTPARDSRQMCRRARSFVTSELCVHMLYMYCRNEICVGCD